MNFNMVRYKILKLALFESWCFILSWKWNDEGREMLVCSGVEVCDLGGRRLEAKWEEWFLERSKIFSSWIFFWKQKSWWLLEGVECCKDIRISKVFKSYEEEGRKYRLEKRSNGVRMFIMFYSGLRSKAFLYSFFPLFSSICLSKHILTFLGFIKMYEFKSNHLEVRCLLAILTFHISGYATVFCGRALSPLWSSNED